MFQSIQKKNYNSAQADEAMTIFSQKFQFKQKFNYQFYYKKKEIKGISGNENAFVCIALIKQKKIKNCSQNRWAVNLMKSQ